MNEKRWTIKKNSSDWKYDIYPEGWTGAMIYNLSLEDLKCLRDKIDKFLETNQNK